MKSILASLVIVVLTQPALGAEWKLISETEDKDKTVSWYVDMTSIVREEEYLRAFLRTTWSVPQYAPDNTPYQSSTYLNYFDCGSGRIAYTGNAYYRAMEPAGKPLHQEAENPVEKLKFQRVRPGSAGEARMKFVCKFHSKNFLTQRFLTPPAG
ncbi:MAG: hypothetical protein RIQ85_1149 [Pseudomonadota bacterium]|jgi:hypothetical protein